MPMTPFIGVRISWLMLARKSRLEPRRFVRLVPGVGHGRLGADFRRDVGDGADPAHRAATVGSGMDFEVTSTIRGGRARYLDLDPLRELTRRDVRVGDRGDAARLASRRRSSVLHRLPIASSGGMPTISVQRGFVYTYRFSASVRKMPIGAASVSSRS